MALTPRVLDEQELASPAPRRPGPLADLFQFRQLIALLVVRELKVRYKRSLFGLLWTMLNPLLLMVVYTVVFTTIMPSPQRNFSVFLLSALLPWLYFSTAVSQGLASVLGNQDLIRKVRVPQAVFPLSVVGSNFVNFALSLAPLFLIMLALRQPFSASLLFLPVATLILTAFVSGVTLLLASATVFFRDVRHLTEVLLQVLFYLSPVIYSVDQIAHREAWWYRLFKAELLANPFTTLLPLVRDPVYYARLPPPFTILAACAWSAGALLIGFTVFQRLEPRHIHNF
jgi:lipopolysaccharide transport system permease protein